MASETTSESLLTVLDAEHPEWRPLLLVIKEALRETERPQWPRFVPALEHPGRGGRRWRRCAGSTAPAIFVADAVAVIGEPSGCAVPSVAKAIMKSSAPWCRRAA